MKRILAMTTLLAASASALAEGNEAGMSGHEAHDGHGKAAPAAVPVLPSPAATTTAEAAAAPSPAGHGDHDDSADSYVWLKFDRLEAVEVDEGRAAAWQGGVSWGTNLDRLWLASEGAREEGTLTEAETQLYWTHAWRRWWDTTLGLRSDNGPGDSRSWAAAGIRGLAPYWFDTGTTLFLSDGGQAALRLEGEYELLLSNRLILQPEVELNLYGKDDPDGQWGRGFADSTAGLRLRYEIRRKFAPYVGVEWWRMHGKTEDRNEAAGERVHDSRAVAGVRIWY